MIKNIQMRISADPRGKIKAGKKSESGLPQSLDYFNISKFPELESAYGLKPTTIIIFLPSNRIIDVFDCNYVLYKRGEKDSIKIRQCDGERCIHRVPEEVNGKMCKAGDESDCMCDAMPETIVKNGKEIPNPNKCRYNMWLKAFIALPQTGKVDNPLCYMFESSSKNSGDAIYSELEKVLVLTGGKLVGIPFAISVNMISGKKSQKQKFPVLSLKPLGTVTQLKQITSFEYDPLLLAQPATPVLLEEKKGVDITNFLNTIKTANSDRVLQSVKKSINQYLTDGSVDQPSAMKVLEAIEERRKHIINE